MSRHAPEWIGQRWESIHEWNQWLDAHKEHLAKYWEPNYGGWNRGSWTGRNMASMDEAIKFTMAPYPEGETLLQHAREQLRGVLENVKAECITRRPRFSEDSGDEVDMDRWQRRDPDFWVDFHRTRKPGNGGAKIVDILAEFNASAHRDAAEIAWRGACAIILADVLQDAGYRVRVTFQWLSRGYYQNGDNAWAQVVIKRPEDPVDFATLAAVNSSWAYRSVGFMSHCQQKQHAEIGMGHCIHNQSEWPMELLNVTDSTIIFNDIWTLDDAARTVRSAIDKIQSKKGQDNE